MKQKTLETLGYTVNALSMALFVYLVFALDAPDALRPLRYGGWLLLGCGMGLVVLSIVALARNRGVGLIYWGIYGIVRHPMYLGAMICYLSFFFFHPHWLILLMSAANIAIVYCFILQGEQQNIARFGEAYRRYMDRVPRINLLVGILRSKDWR